VRHSLLLVAIQLLVSYLAHAEEAPRALAPASLARVAPRRPTFRWALCAGCSGARVELCADRRCSPPKRAWDAQGTRLVAPEDLPPGIHHFRLRALRDGKPANATSAVWSFRVPRSSPAGGSAWGVRADVNGDGLEDLFYLAWPYYGSYVDGYQTKKEEAAHDNEVEAARKAQPRLFLGSSGGLQASQSTPLPCTSGYQDAAALVGDLDGDGLADRAMGEDGDTLCVVLSSRPTRPQKFRLPHKKEALGEIRQVAALGDVNGDGYGDLLLTTDATCGGAHGCAADSHDRRQFVFHGGPAGLVEKPAESWHGLSFETVAAAGDVNGDGYADLAIADTQKSCIFVYHGSAKGVPHRPSWQHCPGREQDGEGQFDELGHAVFGGDFNGDGFADLVVIQRDLTQLIYAGGRRGLHRWRSFESREAAARSVGDRNGDGLDDLAIGSDETPETLLIGSPKGPKRAGPLRLRWESHFAVGDFDGDGADDLAMLPKKKSPRLERGTASGR
jgi:hypothetical protein